MMKKMSKTYAGGGKMKAKGMKKGGGSVPPPKGYFKGGKI